MNEQQRQACLRAMGIQSYFPRFVLPGARPSEACAMPPELAAPLASALQADERLEQGVPGRQERSTPRAALERDEPKQDGVARDQAKAPSSASAPRSARQEALRFHLAFMRLDEQLCVLNLLPQPGPASLSARHERLVRNLLLACGLDARGLQADPQSFRWPFGEGPGLDKGREAARQALRAWLDQRCGESPFRHLLLMGEWLCPLVLDEDAAAGAQRGRLLAVAGQPWGCLATRSLDEVLHDPRLKRDLWRDLAPLRRRA